jgi:subtilisin family serine protease
MIRLTMLAAATLLAFGVSSTADAGGRPDLVTKDLQRGKQYAAGQMIIQYNSYASAADKQRVQKLLGSNRAEVVAKRGGRLNVRGDIDLVKFTAGASMQSKLDLIKNDPAVNYAEPNWIVQHATATNDPSYTDGSLWGMYGATTTPANQYGSGAGEASVNNSCSSVVVGIIDEGYMYSHPDLAANAYTNPGEIPGNGLDDDNNGYIDDVYGWDFAGGDNSVFDGTGDDHGTHVAGTIGALGNNGVGVVGVCHTVKLMNAKFLGARGGTTANAIAAVNYFTNLKIAGVNIVATNNSWGGGGYSQGLKDAIDAAGAEDILFIAAAGNSGANNDSSPSYPSGYASTNIIAVASITSSGTMSSFSQYGATTVDICAPGSAILSTVPVMEGKGRKATLSGGYAVYSGTSMATPHVSGAVAVYAANFGGTAAQIKAAILGNATPTASCNGKVSSNGRLNIPNFFIGG